jgi:3-oxoacyl-[acyl-carrier-protein] synthase II
LALGARAGVHTPVSACASGAEAVAVAVDLIQAGRADVVICGGTEAAIHPLPLGGFAAMRALSLRNDEPQAASRPYDKGRDGFVLGEGAGLLVLESAEHARARGARVYAEMAGAGVSADAHHVAAPDPTGTGAARAMTLALRDAELTPADVVHVNAHATSTPAGDVAEALAIRTALGAAGAVEAIATVLALAEGLAPAIRNLDDLDDDVRLDVVRVDPRPLPPGAALSNAFGFGGHNVSLAFRTVR